MAGELHVEVYARDPAKPRPHYEYGWRVQDANGRLTAIGGEGFTRREDARRSFRGAATSIFLLGGLSPEVAKEMAERIEIVDIEITA